MMARYIFENPSNNYREYGSGGLAFLFTLLFGCFFFAIKGIWSHFFISLILAIVTVGISWLIYPFFVSGIIKKHYLKKGWIEIEEE